MCSTLKYNFSAATYPIYVVYLNRSLPRGFGGGRRWQAFPKAFWKHVGNVVGTFLSNILVPFAGCFWKTSAECFVSVYAVFHSRICFTLTSLLEIMSQTLAGREENCLIIYISIAEFPLMPTLLSRVIHFCLCVLYNICMVVSFSLCVNVCTISYVLYSRTPLPLFR